MTNLYSPGGYRGESFSPQRALSTQRNHAYGSAASARSAVKSFSHARNVS